MEKSGRKKRALYITLGIFIAVLLLRVFVVEGFVVKGDSMSPTIVDGDYVLVNRLAYVFGKPERGDVVIADSRVSNTRLVKRVMGLPGEWFNIEGREFNVDPEEYFLMGDNKDVSIDSRELGGVDSWDIKGKVFGDISIPRHKYIGF
jgi:signal peptidase I